MLFALPPYARGQHQQVRGDAPAAVQRKAGLQWLSQTAVAQILLDPAAIHGVFWKERRWACLLRFKKLARSKLIHKCLAQHSRSHLLQEGLYLYASRLLIILLS